MKHLRLLSVMIVILLALAAVPLKIASAADACTVNYSPANDWGTGATINVIITNGSSTAINGWTLTWTFPGNQLISNLWSGSYTQSGTAVSVTNASYNAIIGANGGTVNFGFNLTYTGTNNPPASFSLNGVVCGGGTGSTSTPTRTPTRTPTGSTSTPTRTATRTRTGSAVTPSRTPTRTNTPTNPTPTRTRTPTRTNTLSRTATPTRTPTRTNTPGGPTATPGAQYTGNATWFSGIGGTHYGGCGVAQAGLDTQNFVALNVQNTPGDYSTYYTRPISSEYASKIGMFNNGLNCGRWVRVTIADYCNGTNDGAQNQPFCRGGSGWVSDQYNGASLDMIVADSCQDGNAWCRDDPYHLDLAQASLNLFVQNGTPVGDMYPNHWNNRQVHWQFIEAPNYTGDIRIGFIQDAQNYWAVISILHLRNGIHGVDYWDGSSWVKGKMDSDMGNDYQISSTTVTNGVPGTDYRIRVYDASDQLINGGRIYKFSYPSSCGSNCPNPFNEVTYTVE